MDEVPLLDQSLSYGVDFLWIFFMDQNASVPSCVGESPSSARSGTLSKESGVDTTKRKDTVIDRQDNEQVKGNRSEEGELNSVKEREGL